MRGEKEVDVRVHAVSNAVQCKYAAAILADLARRRAQVDPEVAAGLKPALGKETAVVLTDENLLLPLLHALPAEIGRCERDDGFSRCKAEPCLHLSSNALWSCRTTAAERAASWTLLPCRRGGYSGASLCRRVRRRADRARCTEEIVRDRRISVDAAMAGPQRRLLKRIFSPAAEWRELSDYLLGVIAAVARQPYEGDDARQRVEFLAVIAEQVTKLRNSLDECDIELATEVYTSLLRRHLQTAAHPLRGRTAGGDSDHGYSGDPQRSISENVILLSMNDDNFPGNHVAQSSFIPYNLRAAYELPTPEHHEGVYAYYFYRLIQRAKSVHMLYCSHADDKIDGRAEPLYLPAGLRERLRRCARSRWGWT